MQMNGDLFVISNEYRFEHCNLSVALTQMALNDRKSIEISSNNESLMLIVYALA